MTNELKAALVFKGQTDVVLRAKSDIERLLVSSGLDVVFVRTSSKKLYILEDSNGGGCN